MTASQSRQKLETRLPWDHALAVTAPALALSDPSFLDDIRASLLENGVMAAVARRDTGVIFDWLVGIIQHQGISDASADAFIEANEAVGWTDIAAGISDEPDCQKLRSYWHFSECGYRKGARTCAAPHHLAACPLPMQPLRNGRLSQGAYSLFLFMRDVCDGDIISWIDHRLENADRQAKTDRSAAMRSALLDPMRNIHGVSDKSLSMALSMLLLVGDPGRESWVTTGAGMIVIDTLLHNFLHRTGILHRFDADHLYGEGCYASGGCADILEELANRIDARAFNPAFPACFPRFVQHSIWRFCAAGRWDICNGNKIDDAQGCSNGNCPSYSDCYRLSLR